MKNNGIRLSYSTINSCLQPENSHNWLNKYVFKLKVPDQWYFTAGTEGHRIIQDHVAGIKERLELAHIQKKYPIVETKKFDEKTKFTIYVEGYEFIGFYDGLNDQELDMLEIKLSSNPWSLQKFRDSIQRKIYGLSKPNYKTATLITGTLKPEEWNGNHKIPMLRTNPSVMSLPFTDAERKEAQEWIVKGIRVFENGDFNGGLDENGRCTLGRMCNYGDNCHFKNI